MSPPAGVSIRDRKMEPSVSERPLGERQTKKNECVLFAPADKTLTPIPPSSPRSGSLGTGSLPLARERACLAMRSR